MTEEEVGSVKMDSHELAWHLAEYMHFMAKPSWERDPDEFPGERKIWDVAYKKWNAEYPTNTAAIMATRDVVRLLLQRLDDARA